VAVALEPQVAQEAVEPPAMVALAYSTAYLVQRNSTQVVVVVEHLMVATAAEVVA
jgi:hypothetical protein